MKENAAPSDRDLAVSGHVNVDRFLRVVRFPGPDRTEPVTASRTELGGTATNLALVAAARGVRVGLLARVGDGFPAEFRRRLAAAGIDLGGMESVAGRPTPTCFIVEDRPGGQRTLIDQGPMGDDRPVPVPTRWLRQYSWVHLGTGSPGYQLRVAEAARDAGLRVAADPAQEIFYRWSARPFRRLLASAEILFGNAAEIARAAHLAGVSGTRGLLRNVPLVVRTEGRAGATALSRAGREHVPSHRPRRVRSVVGAGDAFRGGFYGGFFDGRPLKTCLAQGSLAAARWIGGAR
ncbi:MAG TPA: PfkB family carbohydrate kinase [Thermoplasmata archaeon]|nr:PfkB family carbohydrate kinase [Thermoplasmata archaeon]